MAWQVFEQPPVSLALRRAFQDWEVRTTLPVRADVPAAKVDLALLVQFLDLHDQIIAGGLTAAQGGSLSQLAFPESSGMGRLYEARLAPWSCIYFLDATKQVGVAMFFFFSREGIFGLPFRHFLFQRSAMISAAFKYIEQQAVNWLLTEKGIAV